MLKYLLNTKIKIVKNDNRYMNILCVAYILIIYKLMYDITFKIYFVDLLV